jgi:hypothetical protein
MGIEAAVIGGGLGLIGSKMAGDAANSAARRSANAQVRAAEIAAEEARFRPVGVTSRFGSSEFGFDEQGRLKSAGYEASPEIKALQDRLSAMYGSSLGQAEEAAAAGAPLGAGAQGLFNLANQYLATSPEQARQQYMQEQYALLDPIRQQEEQRLGASVFGRGRAGLNIGTQGQPELAALASARRTQDLQLAAGAEQAAQQRASYGAGLFGTAGNLLGQQYGLQTAALSPFQTQFGITQQLEAAAQDPLRLGAELGGRTAQAGANAGQSLLAGGMAAANTRAQGAIVGPSLFANTLGNVGQNILQGYQNQQMFNQMMQTQMNNPANIYGNTNPFALQSQAGMYGTS